MHDLSTIAWIAEMAGLLILIFLAISAHSAAEKEYDRLRKLGVELPSHDEMSHWQFIQDFLPDGTRRFHQRLMIVGVVLLLSIPAIDDFSRK